MSVDDEDGCTASKEGKVSGGEIMCTMRYHEFGCEE